MLKNFGSWLGLASPTAVQPPDDAEELIAEKGEEKVVEAQNEVNKPQPSDADGGDAEARLDADLQAKGLSGELNKCLAQGFLSRFVTTSSFKCSV